MRHPINLHPSVEVNAKSIESFAYAMKRGTQERLQILEKNNIVLRDNAWYPQTDFINAFYEVYHRVGEMNLFLMGSSIIKFSDFPPMHTLKEALEGLNIAYHMNHRIDGQILYDHTTGKLLDGIGDYLLCEFNAQEGRAIMKASSPYPSKFDEGIIHQLVELFKPNKQKAHFVKVDIKAPQRALGGDSCTFIIEW